MTCTIRTFSSYLSHADQLLATAAPLSALDECVRRLGEVLGFDAAWYGFLNHEAPRAGGPTRGCKPSRDPVFDGTATLNLPAGFQQAWQAMSHEDLLLDQLRAAPHEVAAYRRKQAKQTSGMADMADRFGVSAIATALANPTPGVRRQNALYLSCLRGSGVKDAGWRPDELDFLGAAVETLDRRFRHHAEGQQPPGDEGVELHVAPNGRCVFGRARLRALGIDAQGPLRVPLQAAIQQALGRRGSLIATELGLTITANAPSPTAGNDIRTVRIKPIAPAHLLSPREAQVAALLAQGFSHKEVARLLGIAPATVRNQTSHIYGKLGVNNRVALAARVGG